MELKSKSSAICYALSLLLYLRTCWQIFGYSKDQVLFDLGYPDIWFCSTIVLMTALIYCFDKYGSMTKNNTKEFAIKSYHSTIVAVSVAGLLTIGFWVYLGYNIAIILCVLIMYAFLFNLITTALAAIVFKRYDMQRYKARSVLGFTLLLAVVFSFCFIAFYIGNTFDTIYLILTISSLVCLCSHRLIYERIARL